jgi:hypothetical protein
MPHRDQTPVNPRRRRLEVAVGAVLALAAGLGVFMTAATEEPNLWVLGAFLLMMSLGLVMLSEAPIMALLREVLDFVSRMFGRAPRA